MSSTGELDEFALRDLVRSFAGSNVRHLALDTGRLRVEIEKAPLDGGVTVPAAPSGTSPAPGDAATTGGVATSIVDVTAPSVGIIRWASTGGAGPSSGVEVAEGEPLADLSVLSRRVTLPSPASGRLAEVLVDDGAFVEYGQVLARLEVSPV